MKKKTDSKPPQQAVASRILVVDDDDIIRVLLRTVLAPQFDVITAGSGEDALAICKAQLPDLILLDVNMPELDGYETCRKLREWAEIPIIFVTAHQSKEEHLKAFDAGGDDILTKPIDLEILLRKVALSIERSNEQKLLLVEKESMHKLAMNFLSAVGEGGILQKFMHSSLTCHTHAALGEKLVEAIRDFGMACSVLIRHDGMSTILASHGEPSEIEASVLEQSADVMGRMFQFRQKLSVNYDRVSIIVNNMPLDESEKSERLRNNICTLAEMADALCENVDMRQTSLARAEQMQIALGDAAAAVQELRNNTRSLQLNIRIQLQALIDSVEKTYSWLGTSREQEANISQTMYDSVQVILDLLEAGIQHEAQFNKVLAALRGPSDGGDVELW